MSSTTTKHVSWREYFSQEEHDEIENLDGEGLIICESCGCIAFDYFEDDKNECEDCHNERYNNHPIGHDMWDLKWAFGHLLGEMSEEELIKAKLHLIHSGTEEDDEDYMDGEDYFHSDFYGQVAYSPLAESIFDRMDELAKQGIKIDWR